MPLGCARECRVMKPLEIAAEPKVEPSDRLGAVLPALAPSGLIDADLSNVIVLAHRRRTDDIEAPAVAANDDERPAPQSKSKDRRPRWTLLLAAALLLHLALVLVFLRDPPPLASVGLESISVELVLGADLPAGLAQTPSESESVPSPQAADETPQETEVVQTEPEQETPKAVVDPEVTEPEQDKQVEPQQTDVAAAEPEPEPKPAETEVAIVPQKPVTPVDEQTKVTEKPREQKKTTPKRAAAAPASAASSGIGQGRSDLNRNYPGMVAAHLARHKRFPAEARLNGSSGTAAITFAIDGGGRVTSVSLARSSGVASLDAETQAMVRRAAPFPAPPSGQAMSFTVPVNFNLR